MSQRWRKAKIEKFISQEGSFLVVNSPLLRRGETFENFQFMDLPFYLLAIPWHQRELVEILHENLKKMPLPPGHTDIALRLLRFFFFLFLFFWFFRLN